MYEYKRPRKKKRKHKTLALIIAVAVVFVVGYYIGGLNETTVIYQNETKPLQIVNYIPFGFGQDPSDVSHSSIIIPAVDNEGEGVTTVLTVQIMPGDGRILTNIDKLLFWTDTQNSIRTSSKVASEITGINISDFDVIYTIETNASAVEGPSAGAALVVATVAALEKKTLNPKVLITGTVNHDGTIGPVGEILPKANAARDIGAELFLVPLLQSQEITYETRKYCEQIGLSEVCTTEKIPKKITVAEEAGIDVIEVQTVEEAMEYFLE